MISFDSHIHTEYCGHAPGATVEAMATSVKRLKLESAAITEHIFSADEVKFVAMAKEQLKAINAEKIIIAGAEVDADSNYFDGRFVVSDDVLRQFDYVMAAIHYIPTVGCYPKSALDNPLKPDDFLDKWRKTLIGVVSNKTVDVLAHPARLAAAAVNLDIYFDDVIAILAQAAKISAENNIFWEINNLTGARLQKRHFDNWHKTIQTAIDEGVKITFGSDAHHPDEIARQGYAQQILAKLKGLDKLYSPAEILKIRNEYKN